MLENAVPLARVHRLLDTLSQKDKIRETPGAARANAASDEEDEAEDLSKKALQRSAQIQTALKVTADQPISGIETPRRGQSSTCSRLSRTGRLQP